MTSSGHMAALLPFSLRSCRWMVQRMTTSPLDIRIAGAKPFSRSINVHAEAKTKLTPVEPKPGACSGVIGEIKHDMVHFKASTNPHPLGITKIEPESKFLDRHAIHPIWSAEEIHSVKKEHVGPADASDRLAYIAVKAARWSFDTFSGYRFGKINKDKVINRAIFLETVAGCPGMAGGMLRHLRSLRRMDHDHGWIHTLLEEAENERMHLLTFIRLKQPGPLFRLSVVAAQGIFMNAFVMAYMISPRFCHRFVGYLEEEAVHTYSSILDHIEHGELKEWAKTPAPDIAIDYWRMAPDATLKDLFLNVRADEANHRDVNHTFASLELDAEVSKYLDHSGRAMRQARELFKKKVILDIPSSQGASKGVSTSNA